MDKNFIDTVKFTDVSVEEDAYGRFIIHFKIEGNIMPLKISLRKIENSWRLLPYVFHPSASNKPYGVCNYCGEARDRCGKFLSNYVKEIYDILKEHPAVRMELLF
jgi:hypothetical protein